MSFPLFFGTFLLEQIVTASGDLPKKKEEIKWKIFRKPILLSICIKKYIESSSK